MPLRPIATYARQSAAFSDSVEVQEAVLERYAVEQGWLVGKKFSDRAATGSKKRNRLPGLAALTAAMKDGAAYVIVVQSLYLLGDSLSDLLNFLSAVRVAGCRLVALEQGIDTGVPSLQSVVDVGALLVEHQKFCRKAKIVTGQRSAKQNGVHVGRPKLPDHKAERARDLLKQGHGVRPVARLAGISSSASHRLREALIADGSLRVAA